MTGDVKICQTNYVYCQNNNKENKPLILVTNLKKKNI